MFLWSRVLFRARLLIDRWVQGNAFMLGLLVGGGLTLLVIFVH